MENQQNPTEQQIMAFAGQVLTDLAATAAAVMTSIGHKLGLYRALAALGPVTSTELALRTETDERSIREWLDGQAAGGYVTRQPDGRYFLPPAHAAVLADADSPVFLPPALEVNASLWHDEDSIRHAFKTGNGLGWHEHDCRLFTGTEAFFRAGYRAHLAQEWIPALDGVTAKLERGGHVADVGCGHGASSIIIAQAFPRARVVGVDYHAASIETARARARDAGVAERVRFEVASAQAFRSSERFDLVCFMDAFHDMGDPLQAARTSRALLAEGGTFLLVEPFAHDDPALNIGPVARMYYAASAAICTQHALSQGGRHSLGAQAGPRRVEALLREAGFGQVRVAKTTPFNLVFEARV
jgi:SAM-dependent methyltransferase